MYYPRENKMRKQTESAKKDLFMRVRCHALVAVDDIREAVGLGVDPALLWSAAGRVLRLFIGVLALLPTLKSCVGISLMSIFPGITQNRFHTKLIWHKGFNEERK